MLVATGVLALTALLNLLLGIVVYAYNPGRAQNRRFSIFSANVGLWALAMLLGIRSSDLEVVGFWVRACSAIAAVLPLTFYLICQAISYPDMRLKQALRQCAPLAIGTVIASLMSWTPLFLLGVSVPATANAFAEPSYGPLFLPFNVFIVGAFVWIMYAFIRSNIQAKGVQRIELQYVLLGMLLTLIFTLSTNVFLPLATGSAQTQPFGPLGTLAMNLTIAYGIATRRIMDAAGVLRRFIAYGLLTAYLVLVFFATHYAISRITPINSPGQLISASLLAAIIVAFSMAPAQAFMKKVADWLFSSSRSSQLAHAVDALTASLQSVSTMPDLLDGFADTITRLTGARRVLILLHRKRHFEQVYPELSLGAQGLILPEAATLPIALRDNLRPIMPEELMRERQTQETRELRAAMRTADADLALGIRSHGRLIGMLLLGARATGRIYGSEDQHNLQVICNHLGVAIENARLYTESIQNRLHSVTLLNNLVNGVVATDADGEISMINREAQRICQLVPREGSSLLLQDLPAAVMTCLRRTLEQGIGERDVDADIPQREGPPMPVRIGTSPLHDADGKIMGSLAVLSDQTTVRKLESQIRRTDRLASVGTLAAGMAHEIKNPLVTINTFTQLLPDRYNDPEFRGTFTELVRHEVQRMNSLVNQLLRFARPSPPLLAPLRVSDVLDHSLLLMEQQFQNHRVHLEKRYAAADAMIRADANQLEQAFVNFLLNAIQSMPPNGQLTVALQQETENGILPARRREPAARTPVVRVVIRDTGCGIAPENLNSIFDPFFTTRSEGTGLGLSVAHGIIGEHNGTVEVESALGIGTTFTIAFPVIEQEQGS